jgi:hypothetical protein
MQPQTVKSANQTSVVVELLQNGFVSQTLKRAKNLAKDYEILNPKEVGEFIGNNVFLLDLLDEIPIQIRKRFGKRQKLSLHFVLDPEDPTWHRIHVIVPTKLDFKKAFATMERFDEEWWFDNGVRANSKLMVLLEYLK